MANGLAVMTDEASWSWWDHVTGECFEGAHAGLTLESWSIVHTTVAAARVERPEVRLLVSDHRSFVKSLLGVVMSKGAHNKGFIPPGFARTMAGLVDPRLHKLEQGLGVIVDGEARFYIKGAVPEAGLEDDWAGRRLVVELGAIDRIPRARWADGGEAPMQLLTRWYGFSFSYPGCGVVGCPQR